MNSKNSVISELAAAVRNVPDFPQPGIQFKDITPVLADARLFAGCIDELTSNFKPGEVDAIVGIDARGFIFAGAAAMKLRCGFVPVRKKGKLPWKAIRQDYALEYGTDTLEMHEDALAKGNRVLIVDDLIATGGTAEAAAKLIRRLGGVIVGAAFLVDLPELGGARLLERDGIKVHALMSFEGH
jgi:adenine phosphoribosyltransferase